MAGPTTLRMRFPSQNLGALIDTIVLVMMENRSFDHLLGWMSLPPYGNRKDVEGLRGPIDPATGELTDLAYRNRARNRTWRPYIADRDVPLRTDLPHGRAGTRVQMHYVLPGYLADPMTGEKYARQGFAMDGFAEAYFEENPSVPWDLPRCDPMMMMPPSLVPATAFLARSFMVCDHWFSPIPTDTHPNRLMSLCGFTKIDQTSGEPLPLPDHRTLLDWCDDQKLRWRVYRQAHSFLTLFTMRRPLGLERDRSRWRNTSQLADDFRSESSATFPHLVIVEPSYSDDPTVKKPNDNHPPNPMAPGEAFLADVYRAITSNPGRWQRTLMIVVYDEHGGFFDHVPPFAVTTPSPGFEDDAWKDRSPFTTSGPRVPAIVVSPLVAPASCSSLRFDHTSVLQLLADWATPGYGYSEIVAARHAEGRIDRLAAAILDAPLQGRAPAMPAVPPATSFATPAQRATTAGTVAFARLPREAGSNGSDLVATLDGEVEAALGPVGAYDVVGVPGSPPRAPLRAGDILLRASPGDGPGPVIARLTTALLHPAGVFPPGVEAEGQGDGWYAEALDRTPTGWADAPSYRLVVDDSGFVRPGQILLRRVDRAGG